jgi:hypothetical protein
VSDTNPSWMAEHVAAARDAARRELEGERARQDAVEKAAYEEAVREAEKRRLSELANNRAKDMAQETFRRLKRSSIEPDVQLVVFRKRTGLESMHEPPIAIPVGRAWVVRRLASETGIHMWGLTYFDNPPAEAVPGLWLDDSGFLRAGFPQIHRSNIDESYPLAVWGEHGEPISDGKMEHCDTCGAGTPLLRQVPGYSPPPDDQHGMLLARHLTILLARYNLA